MKIIIAPDSFKGSLSARQLCEAIEIGIHNVEPDAEVISIPLADGGEGTVESLVMATGGQLHQTVVQNPLGNLVQAHFGVLDDGVTAVIEMAQASGLPLISAQDRNPLITTTYGTGQLIRHALDLGFRRFIVGIGGSATNDGGAGMLQALGVRLADSSGNELPRGGQALNRLARIDSSGMDPRVHESTFVIASDVTNPLCGPNGASAVFGPQKGATPFMVSVLDKALSRYADVIAQTTGTNIIDVPGAGAAGGMGAALLAFLGAQMCSGIQLVLEAVRFSEKIQGADLLITGEGKLDAQTLSGKTIAGVASLAKEHGVPVVALCGALELHPAELDQLGITAAFSILNRPATLLEAMRHAGTWTTQQTEQMIRLYRQIGVIR
ncbi:glycerate kinase [Brevibacillus dissolubilis]|uniref:glycerate kinase n=1 Tax=Brevibacillus dissolubilis TaxID=1844116 RepID=UPI001116244E|nr:glycerate kinase [Brevibacillus dissolubilis]